eukprot:2423326-Pleurochrysis_carterae.AAC.2
MEDLRAQRRAECSGANYTHRLEHMLASAREQTRAYSHDTSSAARYGMSSAARLNVPWALEAAASLFRATGVRTRTARLDASFVGERSRGSDAYSIKVGTVTDVHSPPQSARFACDEWGSFSAGLCVAAALATARERASASHMLRRYADPIVARALHLRGISDILFWYFLYYSTAHDYYTGSNFVKQRAEGLRFPPPPQE